MRCAASFCKRKPSKHVGFFRFPKDIVTRQRWIDFCRLLPEREIKYHSRLCSLHFDYEHDLYVTRRGGKLMTVPGAVPKFGNVQCLNAPYEGNGRAMVSQFVEDCCESSDTDANFSDAESCTDDEYSSNSSKKYHFDPIRDHQYARSISSCRHKALKSSQRSE
ncbi:uncharacterized protein LOC129730591 [Wyeomyia smithii]|uniref:uncharacterized protein LOC129730591 n=1 Tax=Wyeomyia smithii TaxID=174621 RepID=UPI0024680EA9|nr:uncharacterized protein LOC129730591 [Wyeomyia smithii]